MTGRPARRKGSAWEGAVAKTLADAGLPFTRPRAGIGDKAGDQGDVLALTVPAISVECKNHARIELAAWLDQAEGNAPAGAVGVVWHHRRGKADPLDGFVTLSGAGFLALLERLT